MQWRRLSLSPAGREVEHLPQGAGGKKVRSRNGYNIAELDASMRKIGSVRDFIEGGSANDPI